MKPLLSIAIATKNREIYCIAAIESILNYNDDRIEITVADNSESTLVKEYIDKLQSPQVKYIYDSSEISSIDNFNRAVEMTTGEFITLIGDDDTILPEMIQATAWMKKNNVDTLTSINYLTYFWPESRPQSPSGTLYIPEQKPYLKRVEVYSELVKLTQNGLINYHDFRVAKSYHGLVKRELMEDIKSKTGNYYGGLSPDIFSVVGLSYLSKKHYSVNFALSIAGICRASTSSNQIFGEHSGEIEDMPHLKNRKNYIWDVQIPRFYCVTNTWAESGLHALKAIGASDIIKKFNVYPVISIGILMNYKHILNLSLQKSEVFRKGIKKTFLIFWAVVLYYMIIQIFKKIYSIIKSKFIKGEAQYENIYTIKQAIDKYLETKKYSLQIQELFNLSNINKN